MAYTVYVIPQAWQEMKALPGNMRQRIKHTVDGLADEPTPQGCKELHVAADGVVLYRIRLVHDGVDTYGDKSLQLLECMHEIICVTIYAEIY